jgi:nicotinamide mononucleotide transporter
MNRIEIAANTMNTVSILLAARNHVWLWWTGIVGSGIFAFVFFDAKLYADAGLQIFFIVTSIVGWKAWIRHRGQPQLPVTSAPNKLLLTMAAAATPAVLGYGFLTWRYTDAYLPFVDAFVTGASVVSQYLLMWRRVQTWPGWLIVNTVSVPLFWSRGLRITAILYAIYWLNAWIGWWHWRNEQETQRRNERKDQQTPVSDPNATATSVG